MRRLEALVALSALMLLAPTAGLAQGAGILKGKVTSEGKVLEGARVYLYRGYAGGFRGPADYEAGPTGADGLFELQPAAGRYFVVARKGAAGAAGELAPGDCFAYYGGNPVLLGEGDTITLGINCSAIVGVGEKRVPGGPGIRGTVYQDGRPLERARVTLYQDGESIFRGIGYASVLTDRRGEFSFNLEEGRYFVVARKRTEDDRMGPLGGGGLFGFAHENPVAVGKDGYTVVSVNTSAKMVKVREGGQDVTLAGTVQASGTVISGVVRDRSGRPVANLYVSAFRDPLMSQKPDFMAVTGADGSYAISLSEGGVYFIGARDTIGGPAEPGDLKGWYAATEDHSVRVGTGEKLAGVDIVVDVVE